jgi:hypothetical protein
MGIYSAQELGFLKSWQSFTSFDTLKGGALASFKEGSQIFVDLSVNSTCTRYMHPDPILIGF